MNKRAKNILLRLGYYTLILPIVGAIIIMATVAYTIRSLDYIASENSSAKSGPDSEMCYVTLKMTPFILYDLVTGKAPYMKPVAASGDYRIDSLIKDQNFFDRLGGIRFSDTTLHYRFYGEKGISENYKNAVRNALKEWSNVTSLKFIELPQNKRCAHYAHIEFRQHNPDNQFCIKLSGTDKCNPHTRIPLLPFIYPAIVSMPKDIASYAPGTYGRYGLIHEIGHALGLHHPRYYANSGSFSNKKKKGLPEKEDKAEHTVMSYSMPDDFTFPAKPMIYDVMAIQHLYGIPLNQTAQPATQVIPMR